MRIHRLNPGPFSHPQLRSGIVCQIAPILNLYLGQKEIPYSLVH